MARSRVGEPTPTEDASDDAVLTRNTREFALTPVRLVT